MEPCYMHDLFAQYLNDGENCMTIQLHTLESAKINRDDICPISWQSFGEIESEAEHGFHPFVLNQKGVIVARMPCNHAFSIYYLIKHFCVSNMRCPMCRKGFDAPLAIQSLPRHMRKEMKEFYFRHLESRGAISPRDVTYMDIN